MILMSCGPTGLNLKIRVAFGCQNLLKLNGYHGQCIQDLIPVKKSDQETIV